MLSDSAFTCPTCHASFDTIEGVSAHHRAGCEGVPRSTLVLDTGAASMALVQMLGPNEIPPSTPDEVTTPPTLTGEHGRAWRLDFEALRAMHARAGRPPNPDDTGVAVWVVEAPWAHPIWHSYEIALIHLREVPGGQRVWKAAPTRTHQIFVFALDPNKPRELLLRHEAEFARLSPMNFAGQFEAESDEAAISRVEATAQEIVEGRLSPDTDFLRMWVARYGSDCVKPGVL